MGTVYAYTRIQTRTAQSPLPTQYFILQPTFLNMLLHKRCTLTTTDERCFLTSIDAALKQGDDIAFDVPLFTRQRGTVRDEEALPAFTATYHNYPYGKGMPRIPVDPRDV